MTAGKSSRLDLEVGLSTDRRTAHEIVRETLRYAILRGQLAGGTRLVLADVAADLGMSVTPVREAMRDLATEGLVHLDPHRGAVVSSVGSDQLEEIVALRLLLEVDLAQHAARSATGDVLTAARPLYDEMLNAPDPATWATLNRDFHLTLYRAAGRPREFEMVRSLVDASMLFVDVAQHGRANRERANDDHLRLLELFALRDDIGVGELMHEHVTIPLSVPTKTTTPG
jgi:DNA-binding GntR family transcriptional regulator